MIQENTQDFARLVELLQKHSSGTNDLAKLETEMSRLSLNAASARLTDYVVLQEQNAAVEAEIKVLFEKHPEWRGEKKSVATPFGSVEQRSTTELQIDNPVMTLALIRARANRDDFFCAGDYIHVEESPDKEALEKLSDEELEELAVKRVKTESITVKPAKVNAAKIVKAAKKKEVA